MELPHQNRNADKVKITPAKHQHDSIIVLCAHIEQDNYLALSLKYQSGYHPSLTKLEQ